MEINNSQINAVLKEADLESLIVAGAPADEYDDEATAILSALRELRGTDVNVESVAAIIAAVWAKSFDLDAVDINARLSAFKAVAARIVG